MGSSSSSRHYNGPDRVQRVLCQLLAFLISLQQRLYHLLDVWRARPPLDELVAREVCRQVADEGHHLADDAQVAEIIQLEGALQEVKDLIGELSKHWQ